MKKNIRKVINLGVYNLRLVIVLGDIEYLNNLIKNDYSYFYEEYVKECSINMNISLACCINTGSDVIIYSDRNLDLSTMMHECIHAMFYLCDNMGIPPFAANEPQAYLFEYISKQIFEWYGVKNTAPKEKKLLIGYE